LRQSSIHAYKSMGSDLVYERIRRLNLMEYNIDIHTKEGENGGTHVRITFAYSKN
jgi:hypothetical protein